MTGIPEDVLRNLGRDAGPEASSSGLTSPQGWFVDWARGGDSSEICVNEHTAYNYAALFTCVKLVAFTVAALPLKVYRRTADGQDEHADHPAAPLLARAYNPNTTAVTGRVASVGHLLTWGNSYTQIVRARNGDLLSLVPITPDLVCPETDAQGRLVYRVRDRETGREQSLPREQVGHVPYFTFDALVGLSTVRVGRGLIRQGLGQDQQAERFVTKGMRSPGAVKFRDGVRFKTAAEATAFRDRWKQIHGGSQSDIEAMILEDGAEWQSLGVDPESAQLLESRKFTRGEIAGYYHIPPVMIGDTEKATSFGEGIEAMNIWFATYCLLPILEMIEQEWNRKLFRADEPDLFVKHELKGLLRGDTLKRSQSLEIQYRNGIINRNEWRRLEGMNPVAGNFFVFPLNVGRVGEDGEDIAPPPAAEQPAKPGQQPGNAPPDKPAAARPPAPDLRADLLRKLGAELSRCLRKEAAEATKAAKRPAEFLDWIDDFYARHAEQVRDVYDTALTAGSADRHLARSRADLLAAAECQAKDLPERVAKCVEKWPTDRVTDTLAELTHAAV